jgi:hypothetical protein
MVCLLGWARDVEHNFHDDTKTTPKKLTWKNTNYKIGYYDDGTVYTCLGGSTFAVYNTKICISIPSGDSVIVSPARVQLKELEVYPMSAASLAVSVSTDSVTWVPIGSVGRLGPTTEYYWWDSMRGNYYISIKNVGRGTAYISKIDYLYHDTPDPESCNCFPAVLE